MAEELPLLLLWERLLGELLDHTQNFPKSVRFTFCNRIDNAGLDVLAALTEARFAPAAHKRELLAQADTRLALLRVLLRLSHDRRYLGRPGFEHLLRGIDEAGRMLGGWRRQQEGRS